MNENEKNKGSDFTDAEQGGIQAVSSDKPLEGIDTCKILTRADLTTNELKAVNYWTLSEGDMVLFHTYCKNESEKLSHLLMSPKVKQYIKQLSDNGECFPLVATKDEIEQTLTSMIRMHHKPLESIDTLAKMKGYYPKDERGGGVNVQINITGGLVD